MFDYNTSATVNLITNVLALLFIATFVFAGRISPGRDIKGWVALCMIGIAVYSPLLRNTPGAIWWIVWSACTLVPWCYDITLLDRITTQVRVPVIGSIAAVKFTADSIMAIGAMGFLSAAIVFPNSVHVDELIKSSLRLLLVAITFRCAMDACMTLIATSHITCKREQSILYALLVIGLVHGLIMISTINAIIVVGISPAVVILANGASVVVLATIILSYVLPPTISEKGSRV